MLEIKLIDNVETDTVDCYLYRIGHYEVAYRFFKDFNKKFFSVSKNQSDGYLPDISYDDIFGNKEFKIQTTSYGALGIEEMKKFMEAYNEAMEVVKILTDKFLA